MSPATDRNLFSICIETEDLSRPEQNDSLELNESNISLKNSNVEDLLKSLDKFLPEIAEANENLKNCEPIVDVLDFSSSLATKQDNSITLPSATMHSPSSDSEESECVSEGVEIDLACGVFDVSPSSEILKKSDQELTEMGLTPVQSSALHDNGPDIQVIETLEDFS